MPAKFGFTLRNTAGDGQTPLRIQVKDPVGTVVAGTDDSTVVDNGTGGFVTASGLAAGIYSVFTGAGAGTLVPELDSVPHGDPDNVPSALPVPVAEGGTGATTAAGARTALGLEIGVDVLAYGAYVAGWNSVVSTWLAQGDYAFAVNLSGGFAYVRGSAARSALGLGDSATLDVGTGAGDVAAGDHDHDGDYAALGGSGQLDMVEIAGALPAAAEAYAGQLWYRSGPGYAGLYFCVQHGEGLYKWMALSAEPQGGGTAEQLEYTWTPA